MKNNYHFSIVIPVLNEEKIILDTLINLNVILKTLPFSFCTYIFDGGSTDNSPRLIKNFCMQNDYFYFENQKIENPTIMKTLLINPNLIKSDYVLIMPADCKIDKNNILDLKSQLEKIPCIVYGGFLKNYSINNFIFKIYAFLQNQLNIKLFKNLVWTNLIFIKREVFTNPKYFTPNIFLEDVILSNKLKKSFKNKCSIINSKVLISARKYNKNPFMQIFINFLIILLFKFGYKNTNNLKRLYNILK